MAIYPCDYCGSRYRGAQQTLYPALVRGGLSVREKRRACPDCFAERFEFAEGKMFGPEDSDLIAGSCCACNAALEKGISVFMTAYAEKQDRQDFFGQLCGACLGTVGTLLLGTQESAQIASLV